MQRLIRLGLLAVALGGVGAAQAAQAQTLGDAARGKAAAVRRGCMACHVAPGVRYPRGLTGPPLDGMGERVVIAGVLPNTPDDMVRWLRDPQAVKRGDAMPNVGLGEPEARDIAAWLATLKR